MPQRPAAYVRISDDREREAKGIRRQTDDCIDYCRRRGWPDPVVYADNDRSASKYAKKARPAYRRMLEDIKAGTVDAVVCWDSDRLVRQPKELEEFFEVCDAAGIKELGSCFGDIDLSSADGQLVARIKGAVAAKESDDKSRRIRRKHRELAEAGRDHGGGSRPFGYEADRHTIRVDEADIVREAARRVLAGESLRGVCRDFAARGITTVTGAAWSQPGIRRVLLSARIAGYREYEGRQFEGTWPGLVDEVTHRRLRRLLLDPSRRRRGGDPRRYLLTGLLVCGRCGARMVARPKQDRRPAYVCAKGPGYHGCGGAGVLAGPLEELTVAWALEALDSAELAAAGRTDDDLGRLYAEIERDEARLEELAALLGGEQVSPLEWAAARKPVLDRLDATRRLVARREAEQARTPYAGQGVALRARWGEVSFDQRRAVVASVVEAVTLGPAVKGRNRFDPDRVSVTWRV